MRRSDKIQIMYARINQTVKNTFQLIGIDVLAEGFVADALILTIYAAEIASRKENRTRAFCAAQTRLLPMMRRSPCDPEFFSDTANAVFGFSVDTAVARTYPANHSYASFPNSILFETAILYV